MPTSLHAGRTHATAAPTGDAPLINRLLGHNWDFPEANGAYDIHSVHPYPAKFIPAIPRTLIAEIGVPPGSTVFDPFCGCGTTLVEAQALGHGSIGIDLNPIACLISRVKTTRAPFGLTEVGTEIVRRARASEISAVPRIPNIGHWFEEDVQQALAALAREIAAVDVAPEMRDCLWLALSSIIVRVSNQESDTRYAAVTKSVDREKVVAAYLSACRRIADETAQLPFAVSSARVIQSDVMEVTPDQIGEPVGLMVTSPPYPNAYEYWLYHKYRMWWLGYDPISVREREIGARAHYFGKRKRPTVDDFRSQMRHVLSLTRALLVPGGYACIVVGRSRIHGREIDNATLIDEVARELGYKTIVRIRRTISATRKSFNLSHARIKTEEVLILRR